MVEPVSQEAQDFAKECMESPERVGILRGCYVLCHQSMAETRSGMAEVARFSKRLDGFDERLRRFNPGLWFAIGAVFTYALLWLDGVIR